MCHWLRTWGLGQTGGIYSRSGTQFGADGGGDAVGVAVHGLLGFGLDHDAGESFGAGVADDDPAALGQLRFGGKNCIFDGCNFVERLLFAHANVDDDLGKDFEVGDEFVQRAAGAADDVEDDEGGEEAIAGGGEMREEDVARLFTAERSLLQLHALENIFVADGSTQHADAIAAERCLEAHVGHGGCDDGSVAEEIALLHIASGQQHYGVAIDDLAVGVGEHGAVGVAVEGHAEVGSERFGFRGDDIGVQRAAVRVDVAAIGRCVREVDVSAQMLEEFGSDGGSGSVGAIQHDTQAFQIQPRNGGAQEALVLSAVLVIHRGRRTRLGGFDLLEAAKDFRFDAKLSFVG